MVLVLAGAAAGEATAVEVVWDGGAGTTSWGDATNWNPDGVPQAADNVTLDRVVATTIDVNGAFACNNLTVGNNVTLTIAAPGVLDVHGGWQQSGSTVDIGGAAGVAGNLTLGGGTLNLSAGTMTVGGATALNSGTLAFGTGTLDMKGDFSRSGTITGSGTMVFSGTAAQLVQTGTAEPRPAAGEGVSQVLPPGIYPNVVFRNGGPGAAKTISGTLSIRNDLTVESTAQLAADATGGIRLDGNLYYSGLPGGANMESLGIVLTGLAAGGHVIAGAQARPAPPPLPAGIAPDGVTTVEVNYLTDPARARRSDEVDAAGEQRIVLENTYALRRQDIEYLLATTDRGTRLVVNLDDMTLIRNPESMAGFLPPALLFETPVTILSTAEYALLDSITIAPGSVLTVNGRLDCGAYTIAGGGSVAVMGSNAVLGIGAATGGVAATVLTTGPNTFTDGSTVDYNAAGDQTVHTASHPAAAMLYTGGSGTKTLDGSKTITGNSGLSLTKAALFVGSGTTFADAGHTLSFTTDGGANVIVHGVYASTGAGGISYESGPNSSTIAAVDGTTFGDLTVNYALSTHLLNMNALGAPTSHVSFRNITFGGTAGSGNGGGTMRLNYVGTTVVTVTGDVNIVPLDITKTGGGFDAFQFTEGLVIIEGDLTTTSTNPTQPIMRSNTTFGSTGTVVLGGAGPQVFTVGGSTNMFTGSRLEIDNPSGVTLGGPAARSYGIAGTLVLTSGTIATGADTLAIRATGSVARTSGHVVGNLAKNFSTTSLAGTMEIGSPGAYTPVDISFASIATPGDLLATTLDGDHPAIASSGLNPATTANRLHRLTNSGIVFSTADVTVHWDPADLDPGADPSSFALGKYDNGVWSYPAVAVRTGTSTGATGLLSFSDFAAGNIGLTVADVTVSEGNSGTASADFVLTLGMVPQVAVAVSCQTTDGTATAPDDYAAIAPPQVVTWNPGDPVTKTVTVAVNGDLIPELDETFFLDLSSLSGATFVDSQAQGTIANDDASTPLLAIDDVAVLEGNAGTSSATFTVTLAAPPQQAVTVEVTTADGSATAADDYVAIAPAQTLTFNPGDPLTQAVAVTVNGDAIAEADETFFVNLANAVNATIADGQGQGTIQNDDGMPALTIDDVTVTEGDAGTTSATFTVTLSGPSQPAVTVDVGTADGSATVLDSDYVPIAPPQTLTFNPGAPLTQSVSVSILGDTNAEPDETFFVNLSAAANAAIADGQGQGTILNDESTGVPEAAPVVTRTFVGANFPNPFSGATTIPVGLREPGRVGMRVYDAAGRLVRTVLDEGLAAGVHDVRWDGRDNRGLQVASGFYVVRVEADGETFARLLKVIR
jgi:hypothetical protein